MSLRDFFSKYRKLLGYALLIVVITIIARFVAAIDFATLQEYLARMPLTFVGVIVVSFLGYFIATVCWRLCMGQESDKVNLLELFVIRHVGETLSIFNPTSIVAGEGLKAISLRQRGVDTSVAVSSILLSRILLVLSAVFLIILSTLYLGIYYIDDTVVKVVSLLVGSVLGVLGLLLTRLLVNPKLLLVKQVERWRERFSLSMISEKTIDSIRDINQTAATFFLEHKGKFLLAFALSVIHWIFGAMEFYLILNALDIPLSIVNAIAIEVGVLVFKSLGAVVPGQLGVEEYGNKIMLDIIGVVSNEVWLVTSIVRRARQLFWLVVAGVFVLVLNKVYKINIART